MKVDVVMPKWGLTMSEATIIRWICAEGDTVKEGDPIVEVETEKATAEVPSPNDGVIVRIVADPGLIVPVGQILAEMECAESRRVVNNTASRSEPPRQEDHTNVNITQALLDEEDKRIGRTSPLARRIARELGIDVTGLQGTGPGGLIIEGDVRAAAAKGDQGVHAKLRPARTEKLSSMRRAIAARMIRSLTEAAQLTISRQVGMAGATALREDVEKGLTLTDVILAAVARVLPHHPKLNSHLIGDELRFFDTVNIGLAIALEDGLVTPIIRDVSALSVIGIATQRRALVERARSGKLRQADLEGGTFTITNLGAYGIDAFTPILNQPEVAILGVGAMRSQATIIKGNVIIRDICTMSLTFDHRALDGAPAALFLADLARLLDNPSGLKGEIQ